MNEIKFKKNIRKSLTLKGKSTILFAENQGRRRLLRWIKQKMEIRKMKYELTKTKNGKRGYSKEFEAFEAAQNELKRWYSIDENKDCGNLTIFPLFPIRTREGQVLQYEEAAALDELGAGWTFVFPQNFSRYDFDNEINEIEEIAD